MIKLFAKGLPREISNKLFNEYQNRWKEIEYVLTQNYEPYLILSGFEDTIKLLLAMSIFYKRILTNLESSSKFKSLVYKKSGAKEIVMGNYVLDDKEGLMLSNIVKSFYRINSNYKIPIDLYNYHETIDFLRKVRRFKINMDFLDQTNNPIP